MAQVKLDASDALIIVDLQIDFCPGGALPVAGGHEIVPALNDWIDTAQHTEATVVASRDWHPPGHVSFRERGGPWPEHCVQGTDGARFHPLLKLDENVLIVTKGDDPDRDQYSAFDDTGLAEKLKNRNVRRLWIGGLAQDVCVRATVLDARKAGFEVHLVKDATRPVNAEPGDGERAVEEMQRAGAVIEEDVQPS